MNRSGMKFVFYPRVSTEMQVDGFSLDGQITNLRRFAGQRRNDHNRYLRGCGEVWKI